MTVREIQSQLDEMHGAEASALPISSQTDAAIEAVTARQSRPSRRPPGLSPLPPCQGTRCRRRARPSCLPGAEQPQPEMDDALAELSRENRPTM